LDLPPAWGDPAALEEIFGNLIDNALRHLDPARPGQVEIGAVDAIDAVDEGDGALAPMFENNAEKWAEASVDGARDASRMPGGHTRTYYVRDNGVGIPAAYLPKLFRAFQRLHGGESAGQGTGLALARRIAERHGGRLWVESTEGAGSTFFIALPDAPMRQA
ncbi:ATP-binding protein, partial [Paraburkholderia sp. Ac-20347]|uniref:sensor histidine kinase n=1 Tax=Paraburkholderia sp. Ac-20347 TaxID=2703892 RepID=UPI001DC27B40